MSNRYVVVDNFPVTWRYGRLIKDLVPVPTWCNLVMQRKAQSLEVGRAHAGPHRGIIQG